MKTKEKRMETLLKLVIIIIIGFIITLNLIILYRAYIPTNKSYAKETYVELENKIEISTANEINLEEIINENTKDSHTEQIYTKEEILEYLTQYKTNKEIPKGISYVTQEGRTGKQQMIMKNTYDKQGNLIKEEQIGTKIIKASSNKIVEIGGANYTSNYKVKKNDEIYVTSDMLGLWSEPSEESRKITTLNQNEKIKVLEIQQNWYKVSYNNMAGWVKAECTLHINLNEEKNSNNSLGKTKQQLLKDLNINMNLNKPSGLTLEQFKKILADKKDINKIFAKNAEYFYYIEKQYNINGVFVAAIGIHESNWGTSKIALEKNNLFGYGAYDSNPYNGAYEFSSFPESIDLISRVLVKYYLNPAGTSIYGGEKSLGTYYNGANLYSVNKKYATDKNWANAVFNYIKYLYNKL